MEETYEKIVNIESYLEKEIKQNDMFNSVLCGAAAGIAAKSVIAPAERIKMTFQVSKDVFSFSAAGKRFQNIVSTQGPLSLWKGHSTTVLRVAPYSGLSYAIHDYSEKSFKNMLQTDKLPGVYKFLAGSLAGSGGTLFTYPLDVMRVRLALGKNWMGAIQQGGLYQGLLPTLMGIIPYSGTAWCVKQTLLEELFPSTSPHKPTVSQSLAINAFAGLCGQFVTYPLDIVRRRMQIAHQVDGKQLMNFREVLRHLVLTEGWRGLSKGFSLNVIKGPIALSISLTTYDLLRAYLHADDPEDGGRPSSASGGSPFGEGGDSTQRSARKVTGDPSAHRHSNLDESGVHHTTDSSDTPLAPPVGGGGLKS